MEKNFSSLLSAICEIKLDYRRVNDLTINSTELSIKFVDYRTPDGKSEIRIALVDDKKNEYYVSERQLAALRIKTGNLKCTWLDEFKSDAGATVFQAVARELLESGKALENIKFKVVAQLKVKNNQVQNNVVPVYKDYCYKGAGDYTKSIRALLKDKTAEFFKTQDYSRSMAEIRETLHASELIQAKATEDNLVLLPVFEVIG